MLSCKPELYDSDRVIFNPSFLVHILPFMSSPTDFFTNAHPTVHKIQAGLGFCGLGQETGGTIGLGLRTAGGLIAVIAALFYLVKKRPLRTRNSDGASADSNLWKPATGFLSSSP